MEQKKRTFNVLFLMRRKKQNDVEASLFCRVACKASCRHSADCEQSDAPPRAGMVIC